MNLFNHDSPLRECQCGVITTHSAPNDNIGRGCLNETREMKSITFRTPNGLPAWDRGDFDCGSPSLKERGTERKKNRRVGKKKGSGVKRERKMWKRELVQTWRWDRNEMPLYREVEWDWWAVLIGCSRWWTHKHTGGWRGLMMCEKELPLSFKEDSNSPCHMDNTYPCASWIDGRVIWNVFRCVSEHDSLLSDVCASCVARVKRKWSHSYMYTPFYTQPAETGAQIAFYFEKRCQLLTDAVWKPFIL